MNYRTQKQAKQTAINTITGFEIELKKIYERIPRGKVDEIIWCVFLSGLIAKCKETKTNIKQTIR